jgi:RNA polymerase sigma-70 factor (ECF subfamily)
MKRSESAEHLLGMDATADVPPPDAGAMLAAVRQHDHAAFTQLVATHDGELVRLAYVITGSRSVAEDATQAAWERLWHRPPSLRDPSKLRSWLLTVCANEARQATRRQRRGAQLEAEAVTDAGQKADLAADFADLQVAIARMPRAERELLALRFAAGLTSAEIADHLGLSPEGARTRLHRVMQRLRQELSHD